MENIDTTVTASDCESPERLGCQVDSESIAPSQIGYTVRVLSQSERCTASDCESPERLGCQVDSESIAPSWIVGCAVRVLCQSERCRDNHNVRVRLRTRRSRAELMLKSETVNPEHVRGEMAKLNPSKATETSLDRTSRDGERLPQRRTARKQWQRNAFTNFTGVPRNPRKLARELMTGNRRKCISKLTIQRYVETPGSPGALLRRTTTCRERFVTPVIQSTVEESSPASDAVSTRQQHAAQLDTSKHVHQAVGVKRRAEVNPMFSSAKRAHAIHPPVPQILSQLRVWR